MNNNNNKYYTSAVKNIQNTMYNRYKKKFIIRVSQDTTSSVSPNTNINILKVPVMIDFKKRCFFRSTHVMVMYENTEDKTLKQLFKQKRIQHDLDNIFNDITSGCKVNIYQSMFGSNFDDRFFIHAESRPDNSIMISLRSTDNISSFMGRKPNNILLHRNIKNLGDQKEFKEKIRKYLFENILEYKPKRLPLTILFFDLKQTASTKVTNIKWGYTYKDARCFGLSTILRNLLQLYSFDHGSQMVISNAVRWGSQIACKKSKMHVNPEVGMCRQMNWRRVPNDLKKQLGIHPSNLKKNRIQTPSRITLEKCRKSIRNYVKTQKKPTYANIVKGKGKSKGKSKTPNIVYRPFMGGNKGNFWRSHNMFNPTKQNLRVIRQYYGGVLPLNLYGGGAKINYHVINENHYGTAARRLTPKRMLNLKNNITKCIK